MPWGRFIKVGIGVLKIPPKDFWDMGLPELYLAIDGYVEANNMSQKPFGKDDLQDLMERYPD
tara:strand:+ start:344 stop:529 length:186 start_codon:yes stop_codon:yes gene_type:complete